MIEKDVALNDINLNKQGSNVRLKGALNGGKSGAECTMREYHGQDGHWGLLGSEYASNANKYRSDVDSFLQSPSVGKFQDFSTSMTRLYWAYLWKHQLRRVRDLAKLNMMAVIKLIEMELYDCAEQGCLVAFNGTNPDRIDSLHQLLLADFTSYNAHCLTTLKVLALQIIIKTKSHEGYCNTILKIFGKDTRFLLQGGTSKVHSLVKLLLNFFSLLPDYKVLFGLKLLQYVRQFDLNFEGFIKNMTLPQFQHHIISWNKQHLQVKIGKSLGIIYSGYSKYFTTTDKIMLQDLTGHQDVNRVRTLSTLYQSLSVQDLDNYLKSLTLCSLAERSSLISFVEMKIEKKGSCFSKLPILFSNFMTIANADFISVPKEFWRLVDKITLFLNENLESIPLHISKHLISNISEFSLNNAESRRLSNIANVAYNAFIIHKTEVFLIDAVRLDCQAQMMNENNELDTVKIEKFILMVSEEYQTKLITIFFNVYTFFKHESLSQLSTTIARLSKILRGLRISSIPSVGAMSELMLCLLSVSRHKLTGVTRHWSPLTQMMYQSSHVNQPGADGIVMTKSDELDPLKRYEHLIKTGYYLSLEASLGESLRLSKITNSYIEKWVARPETFGEKISDFEISLISSLFDALRFHRFYRKIIKLAAAFKVHNGPFYGKIASITKWQHICGYMGLQMNSKVDRILEGLPLFCPLERLAEMNNAELIDFVEVKLISLQLDKDSSVFNRFFAIELPKARSEIADIGNAAKLPSNIYLKFLLLNIKILDTSAMLQFEYGQLHDSLIESKKCLKLCQTLIKKMSILSQSAKWELSTFLSKAFGRIIDVYMRVGVAKECEFYTTEYLRISCSLRAPIVLHDCLHICIEYYKSTGQGELARTLLLKANKTFDSLDGSEDIDALLKFLFNNDEKENLRNSLNLYFQEDATHSLLYDRWILKLGDTLSAPSSNSLLNRINEVNKGKALYTKITSQMDLDPLFRSIKESVTTLPSCVWPAQRLPHAKVIRLNINEFGTPVKGKVTPFVNSPRPSSLTPRGKTLKQNFDRARAVRDLHEVRRLIESLDLEGMKCFEVAEAADLYALSLSLLSSIDALKLKSSEVNQRMVLQDAPKFTALYYDKLFSQQGNEIYSSFIPKKIESPSCYINEQMQALKHSLSHALSTSPVAFNIIGIDTCGITGDLIISKLERHKEPICVRLPLNRQSSRDVDEVALQFNEAIAELTYIINESNRSTSIETTSRIDTREDRRQWWQNRYALDARLHALLGKIERSWFSGFKAFFNQNIVKQQDLDDFRVKFEDVLQRILPTRKQFGAPNSFCRLDDFVLELFLKLDPKDGNFVELMEDLIFFVFDLLLFHGEENAYDEIDTNLMHIQVEELINEYRKSAPSSSKLAHTFLVVSSAGHLIPWESLSFLSANSISRMPCIQSLAQMLESRSHPLLAKIHLDGEIAMVLNPHGDLTRTQDAFEGLFTNWKEVVPNSKLLIGEKPEEKQLIEMLTSSKVFFYIGHGGGEQYVRLRKVKQLDTVAPSFLLGCSSAFMEPKGKLEPSGVVYSYLQGGSCMVVGNLWDVTDKDIDKFSSTLFQELGLTCGDSPPKTVPEAVSHSRHSCHLKYLNGAAPVVYGLPLKFIREPGM
ncbi:LADA_0H09802g1_1 [Lachancea dasiensis]|uniref:separase n=1 Tax=Lachancea dasiensis TaxID=1072105 RepID=A0A1G4K371_9SACH|nr:LADA_0H09802g1_1 [Lachancea dasiensis]